MVHVKKVEIFGFKSFGFENTTVQFEPGLVSISGPNGSGKSNILDAIIFAMGENRPKVMRVDKLRSLIHDIDGGRRGPKMARSSVHFDNTDRKIPIDADTVEITREMTAQGDNIYYTNKKKTNRSQVMDMLDMANAGLGQLNAVQQGTVTRISEFSSEERRTAIEDLVGLTYFDEKKTEAVKQLNSADTRLEVALAKMGEVKKHIDSLDEERNQKLRHDLLDRELARYRAADAAGRLGGITGDKESKTVRLREAGIESKGLAGRLGELDTMISELDAEKTKMLGVAKKYSDEKQDIDREISAAMRDYDADLADITNSKRESERLAARIPEILQEIEDARSGADGAESQIESAKMAVSETGQKKTELDLEEKQINEKRQEVLDSQSRAAAARARVDSQVRLLHSELNASKLRLSKAEHKKTECEKKIQTNSAKLADTENGIKSLTQLGSRLEGMINNNKSSILEVKSRIKSLQEKKAKFQKDYEELELIESKSSKAANQYESKIKTVKGFMHEDYTTARLMADAGKLGILGMAYQVISWEKKYERAVLAVGSDWIKAMVVPDFATLVVIAQAAREKNLPKLRIIPLDAIPDFALDVPKMPGISGVLASCVRCDPEYEALRTFLFGNVLLADNAEAARRASQAGYRAVTISGEYFEARGGTVVIDINSKISKLTKLISMSSDIDGLFQSISIIKKYMAKKRASILKLEADIESYSGRLLVSEKSHAGTSENSEHLLKKLDSASTVKKMLEERIESIRGTQVQAESESSMAGSEIASLEEKISVLERDYSPDKQDEIAAKLESINREKQLVDSRHADLLSELRNKSADLVRLESAVSGRDARIRGLESEEAAAQKEITSLGERITTLEQKTGPKKLEIKALRDREQAILSAGYSLEKLEQVEKKLDALRDEERTLAKKAGSLERMSDSLGRDIEQLQEKETDLKKLLGAFGFEESDTSHDVTGMISGLASELESLDSLNAKAPATYAEVSSGYRDTSARKNELEDERNKIVRFIEGVEKDKKQTFLDAFDTVDKEIRLIFSKMTGGEAWMEIEDEDDIFNSGLSYLIQFKDKPKRESTSISGGEKTLAAIVFVLALQKLKPSPFYLFDEVDAHLDAQNSEKLAKILEERSKTSQFLMVSLKESVIQKANLIYGVFPKKGVSHITVFKDKRMAIRASQG